MLAALGDAQATIITRFDARQATTRHVPRYLSVAEELASGNQTPESPPPISAWRTRKPAASPRRSIDTTRPLATSQRNIELQSALVARDPNNMTFRRNLMIAWSNLADVALGPLGSYSATGSGGPAATLDDSRRQEARRAWERVVEQAQWRYEHDPDDDSVAFDYAMSLGRQAPSFAPGDAAAVDSLERSLALLERFAQVNPGRTQGFIIEFRGSLAERFRQAGQMARAEDEWRRVDAIVEKALAVEPDSYLPRR